MPTYIERMFETYRNGVRLFHFEIFSKDENIVHFVSTRSGGVSDGAYESLNLGFSSEDDHRKVIENRRLVAAALGMEAGSMITSRQVHGKAVRVIDREAIRDDSSHRGMAAVAADAMTTDRRRVCLMVVVADCVPVLLYDSRRKVIGVAHAGWRGLVRGVIGSLVEAMQERFGCTPGDIRAGVGPSIGPCCYEVGPEVLAAVADSFGQTEKIVKEIDASGRGYLDLWQLAETGLLGTGLVSANIETARLCSSCHHEDFFSYRYHGPKSGRFAAGIMMGRR